MTVGGITTPFTHSPDACIRIGDGSFVNGTRFGCAASIEIGADTILADARILDTDFHPLSKRRNRERTLHVAIAPIRIRDNAWICADAVILKGITIGENAVVAIRSVVVKDVPANRMVAGNPARDIGPVPD